VILLASRGDGFFRLSQLQKSGGGRRGHSVWLSGAGMALGPRAGDGDPLYEKETFD